MKTISKKEWDKTPKDYKSIIDGQPYKMFLDEETGATVLAPVKVRGFVVRKKGISLADNWLIPMGYHEVGGKVVKL